MSFQANIKSHTTSLSPEMAPWDRAGAISTLRFRKLQAIFLWFKKKPSSKIRNNFDRKNILKSKIFENFWYISKKNRRTFQLKFNFFEKSGKFFEKSQNQKSYISIENFEIFQFSKNIFWIFSNFKIDFRSKLFRIF